jgi:large subunit ribosomal protein L6
MPVVIPAGVTVQIAAGNIITVKGPKGTLEKTFSERMTFTVEGNQVLVTRPTDEKEDKAVHGLCRALLQDMVTGVSEGYKKVLMIIGVGYKAVKAGKTLQLFLGHSLMPGSGLPQEKFLMQDTDTIKLSVPNDDEIKKAGIDKMTAEKLNSGMIIVVEGIDKQEVGQVAAVIRSKRPPEPYHGKGVRYIDENVRRKAGKTGK